MKMRIALAAAFVLALGTWASAQKLGNGGFEPVYGVGGGGGGGDITAVGDCTSGACMAGAGTTILSGTVQFAGAVDTRSSISNGGSATCFTGVTGVVCSTDNIAINTGGSSQFIAKAGTTALVSGMDLYNSADALVTVARYYGSAFSDADYADKFVISGVSKMVTIGRSDDVAAGTAIIEVRDNVTGSGNQLFSVDGSGNVFLNASATRSKGSITLAAGTGTATVVAASVCTCADTTAANACRVSLSGTTLTITGTGTDVVNYLCF
jgi:hypothetical protein